MGEMRTGMRTGGQVLVDALKGHGVDMAFAVPGESYLAVLDALHDASNQIRLITCRQEGGAAYMAEAYGKLTGKPGICLVTRGPGATNASVYLTVDWGPQPGTSDLDATLLANALLVDVYTEGNQVYSGRFMDLINQPVVTELEPTEAEGVAISVIMPDNRTGPTLLGKAITADFVFIAVSVEA